MGLFDKLGKGAKDKIKSIESSQDLGEITQSKAISFIKDLSGGEVTYSKKIPDNIVMFTSTSGAGASTLVANVAYVAASKFKLSVVVLDLNIMMPSQNNYFNIKQEKIDVPDLVTYLLGKTSLGESVVNKGSISIMYSDNKGLMDSIKCESDIAVDNFTEMLGRFGELFDLVLIDCPMRIDHTLCNTAMYLCDSIYMVWDEGMSSIANTEKIRRNMAASGIDSYTKMQVVLNKRTNVHYSMYPIQKLNLNLVEVIPFDPDVIDSSLRAEVFCQKGASRSENAIEFAKRIEGLTEHVLEDGGYLGIPKKKTAEEEA